MDKAHQNTISLEKSEEIRRRAAAITGSLYIPLTPALAKASQATSPTIAVQPGTTLSFLKDLAPIYGWGLAVCWYMAHSEGMHLIPAFFFATIGWTVLSCVFLLVTWWILAVKQIERDQAQARQRNRR